MPRSAQWHGGRPAAASPPIRRYICLRRPSRRPRRSRGPWRCPRRSRTPGRCRWTGWSPGSGRPGCRSLIPAGGGCRGRSTRCSPEECWPDPGPGREPTLWGSCQMRRSPPGPGPAPAEQFSIENARHEEQYGRPSRTCSKLCFLEKKF